MRHAEKHTPITAEEIAPAFLVVVVFLGSVWCVRRSRHIQVDVLYHYLPHGVARVLSTVVDIVRVVFFAYASLLLWRYVGIVHKERMVTVAWANWRRGYSVLDRPEAFDGIGD